MNHLIDAVLVNPIFKLTIKYILIYLLLSFFTYVLRRLTIIKVEQPVINSYVFIASLIVYIYKLSDLI